MWLVIRYPELLVTEGAVDSWEGYPHGTPDAAFWTVARGGLVP